MDTLHDETTEVTADRLAWLNDDQDNTLADYFPGWQHDPYTPDAWSERFHAGFTLALEGESPAVPTGLPGYEARAFEAGVVAGTRLYQEQAERERIDYEAWLEELAIEAELDDRYNYFHPCEAIEAQGVIEARKG